MRGGEFHRVSESETHFMAGKLHFGAKSLSWLGNNPLGVSTRFLVGTVNDACHGAETDLMGSITKQVSFIERFTE